MSGMGSPGFGPGHLHAPQLDADSGFPEVTGSRPTHALALPDSKGKDIALRPREGGEPSSPSAPPASEGGSEGAPRPRTAQRRASCAQWPAWKAHCPGSRCSWLPPAAEVGE